MINWTKIHKDFTPELQQKWEKLGFNYQQTKSWIEDGLTIKDYEFAYYLKQKNFNASELSAKQLEKLRKKYDEQEILTEPERKEENIRDWKNIHPNFTKELQKEWEERGFGYEECKDWINIGLTVNDAEYAYWLKEIKQKDSDWVHNYGNDEELREEYGEHLTSRWHKKGFADEEINLWVSVGLELQDGGYAAWMRDISKIAPTEYSDYLGEDNDDSLLREQWQKFLKERKISNWKNISPDFTTELKRKWEDKSFNSRECKEWIDVGLTAQDAEYASWLRDVLKIIPDRYLDYLGENDGKLLRERHQKFNEREKDSWEKTKSHAQQWLDREYPKEKRFEREARNIHLTISNNRLEGSLDLSDFIHTTWLECHDNKLTSLNLPRKSGFFHLLNLECHNNELSHLDLSKNSELFMVKCFGNKLTKLDLSKCNNLAQLYCDDNLLTNLDFLSKVPNPEKITIITLANNDIGSTDLSIFSRFVNLEFLIIGNTMARVALGGGNHFYGSLKPLKNLKELKCLEIGNTDIDEGLEYLPENCEKIYCEYFGKAKVVKIAKELKSYKQVDERGGVYYDIRKLRIDKDNLAQKQKLLELEEKLNNKLSLIEGQKKKILQMTGSCEETQVTELENQLIDLEKTNQKRFQKFQEEKIKILEKQLEKMREYGIAEKKEQWSDLLINVESQITNERSKKIIRKLKNNYQLGNEMLELLEGEISQETMERLQAIQEELKELETVAYIQIPPK